MAIPRKDWKNWFSEAQIGVENPLVLSKYKQVGILYRFKARRIKINSAKVSRKSVKGLSPRITVDRVGWLTSREWFRKGLSWRLPLRFSSHYNRQQSPLELPSAWIIRSKDIFALSSTLTDLASSPRKNVNTVGPTHKRALIQATSEFPFMSETVRLVSVKSLCLLLFIAQMQSECKNKS